MPRKNAYFDVPGLAPTGSPAWRDAPASVKEAWKKAAIAYVLKAKDQDLAAGLDKDGEELAPIAKSTRENRESKMGPADPNAPPLMPAYATSRTRLWLTASVVDGYTVRVSWRNGWGEILIHHANRKGRKKRDVFGLSPAGYRKARGWLDGWWVSWVRTGVIPTRNIPETGEFRPLPVIGRTDFERFTFGIGTGTDQAAEVARQRVLLAQGRTTGFFRRGPGQGVAAIGGPGGERPGPAVLAPPRPQTRRPPVAPSPTVATPVAPGKHQLLGATFQRDRSLGSGWVTVLVDVAKVEAEYMRDREFYVGPGGVGGIDDRYQQFEQFLDESIESGRVITQSRLGLSDRGKILFGDGRHRWAVLRDRGARVVPVTVRRSDAAEITRRFGPD